MSLPDSRLKVNSSLTLDNAMPMRASCFVFTPFLSNPIIRNIRRILATPFPFLYAIAETCISSRNLSRIVPTPLEALNPRSLLPLAHAHRHRHLFFLLKTIAPTLATS